jgi:DNA-binding transcriptional LysR family regulator
MAFDLRALRAFVAVAEELHFTRAAERLYVAQPALSEQIRRLERDLGVRLLERTTRRVELTAAGEALLVRARRILAEADAALADAARAARGETGRLRVATGSTAGIALVPRILRAFRAARPGVDLELRESDFEDYSGGLDAGSVDAAFVWLPLERAGVRVEALHEEPRVVALEAGHRLAAEPELRLAQLTGEPWPWAETDPAALAFWTCGGRRGPRVRSMEGMLEAVRAGLCVASVPRSQAEATAWPGIAFRPVADLPPATLALAWRTSGAAPAVAALVDTARGLIASER